MRDRTNMVNAARVQPAVIQQHGTATPHRSTRLIALNARKSTIRHASVSRWRCWDYPTALSCDRRHGRPPDHPSQQQRIACRDTCERLGLEFAAAAKAVEAKATVNQFMGALKKAALDTFSTTVPPPTAVGAIIAALGAVGNTLSALLTAITNLPDALTGAITLSSLLGSDSDDKARQLIQLNSQGSPRGPRVHSRFQIGERAAVRFDRRWRQQKLRSSASCRPLAAVCSPARHIVTIDA